MITTLTIPIHLPVAISLVASSGLNLGIEEGTKFSHAPTWATAKRPILPLNAPTAGYLCGGAGIMSAGFETAGIGSLWNIDRDPGDSKLSDAIADIYERNFSSPVIRRTLQEVAGTGFTGLERPDILVLTQSCRNLSRSNPKAAESAADTAVATAAVQAIQHFVPKVFVAENVPQYAKSESWRIIKIALEQLGYNITAGVINAANYGVPQKRSRFIAIAILNAPANDLSSRLRFALPTQSNTQIGWLEAVIDLLGNAETVYPTVKQLEKIEILASSLLAQPLLMERGGVWGSPKVKPANSPCWTIRKSIWLDQKYCSRDNAISIRLPDGSWKNLGVRGAARLCSIPDWFWLPDEAWSAGSAIGNGVPCLLGEAIALSIKPFIVQVAASTGIESNLKAGTRACCTSTNPKLKNVAGKVGTVSRWIKNESKIAWTADDSTIEYGLKPSDLTALTTVELNAEKLYRRLHYNLLIDENHLCILTQLSESEFKEASNLLKDLGVAITSLRFGKTLWSRATDSTDSIALTINKNHYNPTTIEDKTMTVTTKRLTANTVETVVNSEVPTSRKVKQPKIRNQHLLENPEIEATAASVVTSSFAQIKDSLLGMVEEGRKLIDIKISMYSLHGEKSGEKKFKKWLNSSDWGGFGKHWAASALTLAEWWMTLPLHVQDWLPNNIQGWSNRTIAKLPVASAIGHNFMMALVRRGKQSAKGCDRALKSKKLKIGHYAVVVERDEWKGEIGKVVAIETDGMITLEFPTDLVIKFAPEKLEKWVEEVPVIAIGDRITVVGDYDWANHVGTVVGKKEPNGWWVQLDAIAAKGSSTKHLFKTSQLKNLIDSSIWANLDNLAEDADWEKINNLYDLSQSDQTSVKEQALLLASTEAGEDSEPNVTIGHIKSVLDNFGFQPQQSTSNPASNNSEEKVYTKAELEALKAQWEQQIRSELIIGLKSELRSQVEREVASELAAAKTHTQQLTTKYQEALKTLEASKEKINQVQQLENELQAIRVENDRLKQFMAEEAANPGRWEKTFSQEAQKAITTELESKYSPLVEKLEEMTLTVEQQDIELQQYRQSVDENQQLKQSVKALQQQLNQRQAEVEKFKTALINPPVPQEVEILTVELGEVGERAGWTGWTARGYRSQDGTRYTGLAAIKAFIQDVRGEIVPLTEEVEIAF